MCGIVLSACGNANPNDKEIEAENNNNDLNDVEYNVDKVDNNSNEDDNNNEGSNNNYDNDEEFEFDWNKSEEKIQEVVELIEEDKAFDAGSYIEGDIPEGDYAFIPFEGSGEYYSEEDSSGSIIDNENFKSFGYVHVHEKGNLETKGALVSVEDLEDLDVSGAKELYEVINDVEDYDESGWYKVGTDIDPGEYTLESYGSAYVSVMDGPVGNSNIVTNDNFDGKYSINVEEGQYLNVSKATITDM